jgi:hypothetical protein
VCPVVAEVVFVLEIYGFVPLSIYQFNEDDTVGRLRVDALRRLVGANDDAGLAAAVKAANAIKVAVLPPESALDGFVELGDGDGLRKE